MEKTLTFIKSLTRGLVSTSNLPQFWMNTFR